jgi:hypothetical protein
MEYKGTWNASTNTPTLANGTGDTGDVYICNVAGTVNFGAGAITFAVGDYVIYSGSIWQRSSGAVGTVTSVALTVGGDAISVSGSPLTTSGTLALTFNGTTAQYIRGNGTLETFPTSLISGTGNVNAIPKFTANTVLGNSVMEDDGNFVSMRGLKINAVAGTGNTINFQQGSGITAAGLGYSTIGAASTTGFAFYIDQNTTSRSFILDTSTITSATQLTYSLPASSGTLALTSDIPSLTGYVPYTGATANVNLGTHTLIAAKGTFSSSGSGDTVGITHSSGSGIALNITKGGNGEGLYINKTSGSGNAATIIGTLNATTLVKSGGTSSQFLKADGSVDSTSYGTGSVTSVGLSSATSGISIFSTPITTNGTITIDISTASGSGQGLLSSTDWTTFNNKQNALTNPVTGTGTTNYLPKFTGASTIGNSQVFDNGTNIGIGTASPVSFGSGYTSTDIRGTNGGGILFGITSGVNAQLYSDATSTVLFSTGARPFELYVNSALALKISSTGNLGLGVTPSAWRAGETALQIGAVTSLTNISGFSVLRNNNYVDTGGTERYLANSNATALVLSNNGEYRFLTAPSGTAGNAISFTQAMTLTSAGELCVGRTTAYGAGFLVNVEGNIYASAAIVAGSSVTAQGGASSGFVLNYNSDASSRSWAILNDQVAFGDFQIQQSTTQTGTTRTARLYINPSGNVGIGTTSPTSFLHVYSSASSNTTQKLEHSSTFGAFQIINNASSTLYVGVNNSAGSLFGGTGGAYGGAISMDSAYALGFATSGSERMRITSGGTLLVGTTSTTGLATGSSTNVGISLGGGVIASQVNNNSNQYWSKASGYTSGDFTAHFVNNTYVGGISTNGATTTYAIASDYRLKTDLKEFNGLDLLNKIKTYDYKWKSDGSRMYGVIAHELQSIINYAVTGVKDGDRMQGVDYSKIVPVLIKAIQEQQTQIEQLKNK